MLSLIAFAIIAVIIVTVLLTFNVRSLSRAETAKKDPAIKIKESKKQPEVPRVISTQQNKASSSETSFMSDEQYRNSVRQFFAQNSKSSNSFTAKKSDEEYRSALRAMSAKTKK